MKKWLFLSIAGVIALLLVISGIWVGFGPGIVKSKLIETVYAEKQRVLRIDGPFHLQLLPQPVLEVHNVHLSAAGKQDAFMDVGQLKASVRFWPLLKGSIVLDELVVDDIQLQLVRFADGSTNFDDLWPSSSDTQGPDIFVEDLRLSGVQIGWQDDLSGRNLGVKHASLQVGPIGKASQGVLHTQGTFVMGQDAPDLKFELGSRYQIMAAQRKVGLEAFRFQVSGDFITEALPGVSGAAEGSRGGEGAIRFQVDMSAPVAALEGDKASLPSLLTHLNFEGPELKGEVTLSLDSLQATLLSLEVGQGGVNWDVNWKNLAVMGSGSSAVHYDFAGQKLEVPSINGKFEVSYPDILSKALAFGLGGLVQADMAQGELRGEIQLALDESHLAGAWLFNRLPLPVLQFKGSLDRLNLDQYLRVLDSSGAVSSNAGGPSVKNWKAEGAEANSMEIRGRLQVGELHFRSMKIKNLESRLTFRDGRLDIDSQSVTSGDIPAHQSEVVLP